MNACVPLSDDERSFLLGIVDDPHSDYNDELEGWPNYRVENGHLIVTFTDEAGRTMEGRWRLTFVRGEANTERTT